MLMVPHGLLWVVCVTLMAGVVLWFFATGLMFLTKVVPGLVY